MTLSRQLFSNAAAYFRRGRQDYPSTDEDPRQPPQNSRPLHESPLHQQQYPSLALPSPSSRQHRPRDQDSVDMPAHHRPAAKSRDPEYERRRGKVSENSHAYGLLCPDPLNVKSCHLAYLISFFLKLSIITIQNVWLLLFGCFKVHEYHIA